MSLYYINWPPLFWMVGSWSYLTCFMYFIKAEIHFIRWLVPTEDHHTLFLVRNPVIRSPGMSAPWTTVNGAEITRGSIVENPNKNRIQSFSQWHNLTPEIKMHQISVWNNKMATSASWRRRYLSFIVKIHFNSNNYSLVLVLKLLK